MNKIFWFLNRVWQLPKQYSLEQKWIIRYSSAKLALGLPGVHDTREFTKINTLDKGSREAFIRALIIEIDNFNYNKSSDTPGIIRWRQVFTVIENLNIWGIQKDIYVLKNMSDSKPVRCLDIKGFDGYNIEDKIII